MVATMKAAVCTRYGDATAIQMVQTAVPVPKANEVLIRVKATSVSSGDARLRRADPAIIRLFFGLFKPRQAVFGAELAGVVEAVGENVTTFAPGDEVMAGAGMRLGAHAEFITLPESGAVVHKPKVLSFEQAAAVPFGATASWFFLKEKVSLKAGQRILINGASGALGSYAIQLAKSCGAHVTAVCSDRNLGLVEELGADAWIDYTKASPTSWCDSASPFHFIYDTVGTLSFSQSRHLLVEDGTFISASAGLKTALQMFWSRCWGRQKVIMGVVEETQAQMLALEALIRAGTLKPVVDRVYPFEQIQKAHQYVDSQRKKGAVILTL